MTWELVAQITVLIIVTGAWTERLIEECKKPPRQPRQPR